MQLNLGDKANEQDRVKPLTLGFHRNSGVGDTINPVITGYRCSPVRDYGTGVMSKARKSPTAIKPSSCSTTKTSKPISPKLQGSRTCELCRSLILSDADHERHFRAVHCGWVDQLVISICLPQLRENTSSALATAS